MVSCHGGPGLWDHLGDLADLLTGERTVVRYDQRGCGRSGGAGGPFTLERAVEPLLPGATGLRVPVMMVHGAEDPRPAWTSDDLLAALPRATRTVVAGAGHAPWVERPDEVRRLVGRALDRADPPA